MSLSDYSSDDSLEEEEDQASQQLSSRLRKLNMNTKRVATSDAGPSSVRPKDMMASADRAFHSIRRSEELKTLARLWRIEDLLFLFVSYASFGVRANSSIQPVMMHGGEGM